MSRAKRTRKARMARRREKRLEIDQKISREAFAFFVDAHERARVRREINASDAPEALKTVLGFFVDPVGAITDMAAREMARRQREEQ